ncbi:MAG: hypothetical protein AAFX79_07230 [Planctomycetota bacterium]
MKRVACGVLAAFAGVASAEIITLDLGAGSRHNPLPGATGATGTGFASEYIRGGEFVISGLFSHDPFSSFCLELNETIAGGTSYIASVDTAAVKGGVGGPSPDPLSNETAALYREFARGNLTADDGESLVNFHNALQDAFWFLEEELGEVDFSAATAEASSDVFGDLSDRTQGLINSVWGTTAPVGGVRVLNLVDATDGRTDRQSVLVLIPLPGAGGLALAGLLGVAAIRRRLF